MLEDWCLLADLSFTTGQLIVSNSVDRELQGIAGNQCHCTG